MTGLSKVGRQMPKWGVAQVLGQRESQQDSFTLKPVGDALLALVTDGMGGHANGGLASAAVARAFSETLELSTGAWPDRLEQALEVAQNQLTGQLREGGVGNGAGTTLVAAVIDRGQVWHLSVGDSILALFEGGAWRRLNADHSMLPVLERQQAEGLLEADDLATHPARNQLRSAIMAGGVPAMIDCPPTPTPMRSGAWLLLMSDGMAALDTAELAASLFAASSPQEAAKNAMDDLARLDLPGQDNATLVVVQAGAPRLAARVAMVLAGVVVCLALVASLVMT